MDRLFELIICHEYEDYAVTDFSIGLFETREEANQVGQRYLKEVTGFKDYSCFLNVLELPLIGESNDTGKVFRFVGWNVRDDYEEEDIVYSSAFYAQEEAERAFQLAKQAHPRQEWAFNCQTVGQCSWEEGFKL